VVSAKSVAIRQPCTKSLTKWPLAGTFFQFGIFARETPNCRVYRNEKYLYESAVSK